MLRAYFDDSGTHKGARVIVWGVLLGTDDQWGKFENAWRTQLRSPLPGKLPLPRFHLAACAAGADDFSDYSLAERDHVTYLFRSIIVNAGLVHLSSVVSRPDWDELIVGTLRERIGDAESAAFLRCIKDSLEVGHLLYKYKKHITMTFDIGRQTKLQSLADRVMEFERKPLEIEALRFEPVELFPPLQGADMVATESFWASQKWLDTGTNDSSRAHFRRLLEQSVGKGSIADREVIMRIVDGYLRAGMSS
jgi:hypothetical protein